MNKYNGNKEFKIDIPKSVKLIIDILEKNGYEAFAVGGCVRDTILDRKPQDWDITTSALPNQVKEKKSFYLFFVNLEYFCTLCIQQNQHF